MVNGENETRYYYQFDGLGSVVALSNENSEIAERYSYDVYGEPNSTSSIGNPYLFTSRAYDSEVGLYYYRARYYSTGIGRFLHTDPVGYSAGLNFYTYCDNNPTNRTDPLGLLCKGSGRTELGLSAAFGAMGFSDPGAWGEHYAKLWKYRDDVLASVGASALLWYDVLGVGPSNKFGRHDVFDPEVLDRIINSHPDAGVPGASADETFWDNVHFAAGAALEKLGADKTSAYNILLDWERIEPVLWSGWRPSYQGRNLFEKGQEGIERDMDRGMAGYYYSRSLRD